MFELLGGIVAKLTPIVLKAIADREADVEKLKQQAFAEVGRLIDDAVKLRGTVEADDARAVQEAVDALPKSAPTER